MEHQLMVLTTNLNGLWFDLQCNLYWGIIDPESKLSDKFSFFKKFIVKIEKNEKINHLTA